MSPIPCSSCIICNSQGPFHSLPGASGLKALQLPPGGIKRGSGMVPILPHWRHVRSSSAALECSIAARPGRFGTASFIAGALRTIAPPITFSCAYEKPLRPTLRAWVRAMRTGHFAAAAPHIHHILACTCRTRPAGSTPSIQHVVNPAVFVGLENSRLPPSPVLALTWLGCLPLLASARALCLFVCVCDFVCACVSVCGCLRHLPLAPLTGPQPLLLQDYESTPSKQDYMHTLKESVLLSPGDAKVTA